MHTTLVEQGLQLLVGGLSTVFFFLSILIILTAVMSSVVSKWIPAIDPSQERIDKLKFSKKSSIEPRIARVIQAALDRHLDDN
jgi:oxaloacetate decarboxylase gamma subunit